MPDQVSKELAKKERRAARREAEEAARRRRGRRKRARTVGAWGLAAAAAAGVLGLIVISTNGAGVSVSGNADNGRPLPEFTLPGFDGSRITNASIAGKPAVINFFATWCPQCVHEMPAFQRVYEQLGDDVHFIGVNQRDSDGPARRLREQTGVSYPLAFDRQGRFFDSFNPRGTMPVTVFVLADGTISNIHVGELDETSLTAAIRQRLLDT